MASVWPVQMMLYRDGKMDERAMGALTEFYISNGVGGIFTVCLSSEMFHLSKDEQVALADFTVRSARGRVPVVASGHIEDAAADQIKGLARMAETGVDALILSSNRLGGGDDLSFARDVREIMAALPGARFGLYECPVPFKRLLTEGNIKFLADTGRFSFIKDTCCDQDLIKKRLNWLSGSNLELYNANGATFGQSVRDGAAGYSGVMANIHPDLYAFYCQNPGHPLHRVLESYLSVASALESRGYPVMAKHLLALQGVPCTTECRSADPDQFNQSFRLEAEHLLELTNLWRQKLSLPAFGPAM